MFGRKSSKVLGQQAMRILIVSDTHRRIKPLQDVLEKIGPLDMLIHLGDSEGQDLYIREIAGCPCHIVAGNCDYGGSLPLEEVITIGKYQALLTHGHRYVVSATTVILADKAANYGCQIAMYGHTHVPEIKYERGVTLLNPGSLSLPRQSNLRGSYILMEIDREGEAHYTICYL